MTTETAGGHDDIAAQLGQLTDLFKRRLLDDRTMRQVLESQQERIKHLEAEIAGERIAPLLRSLGLVIDRARGFDDEAGLGVSIAEEIIEALAAYGYDAIDDDGPLNPALHEPIGSADLDEGRVRVTGVGFRKGAQTLVPARVLIARQSTA